MALDVGRSLTSAGVGVVDVIAEKSDEKAGRIESFRNARDISRLVIAGIGYGLQVFMPRHARLGETLALSATPLVIKSIASPLMGAIGGQAGAQAGATWRRRVSQPMAVPAGSHVGAETPQTKVVMPGGFRSI